MSTTVLRHDGTAIAGYSNKFGAFASKKRQTGSFNRASSLGREQELSEERTVAFERSPPGQSVRSVTPSQNPRGDLVDDELRCDHESASSEENKGGGISITASRPPGGARAGG